jgi:hypothetical protein
MEEFEKRLRGYASGKQYYKGEPTKTNLKRWADRATANSDGNRHRADGVVDVGGTSEPYSDLPKAHAPGSGIDEQPIERASKATDSTVIREAANRDVNHVGSDYCKGIRRKA